MTTFHQWQPFDQACPNCGTELERHTKNPHTVSVGEHVACPECESKGRIQEGSCASVYSTPFQIDWTADDCDYDQLKGGE